MKSACWYGAAAAAARHRPATLRALKSADTRSGVHRSRSRRGYGVDGRCRAASLRAAYSRREIGGVDRVGSGQGPVIRCDQLMVGATPGETTRIN